MTDLIKTFKPTINKSNGKITTNTNILLSDYTINVDSKKLYSGNFKSKTIGGLEISGDYIDINFTEQVFIKEITISTNPEDGKPTIITILGKDTVSENWNIVHNISEKQMNSSQKIYPLNKFKFFRIIVTEIKQGTQAKINNIELIGNSQLISEVHPHSGHSEHFSNIDKKVSFDESKNAVYFINNPILIDEWVIPSVLVFLIGIGLYIKK